MRPDMIALTDQAEAASADAIGLMHTVAGPGELSSGTLGPIARAVITRMHTAVLAAAASGAPTLCPHLSFTAPALAFWLAHGPGKLRCAACATIALRRIQGTREDRRCDHCGRVRTNLCSRVVLLPAIVVDLPASAPCCIPPASASFGLCDACQQDDTLMPRWRHRSVTTVTDYRGRGGSKVQPPHPGAQRRGYGPSLPEPPTRIAREARNGLRCGRGATFTPPPVSSTQSGPLEALGAAPHTKGTS
ncbi:MAG: hypothetical protein ACRDQB_00165 [Thermocrispum sp.]